MSEIYNSKDMTKSEILKTRDMKDVILWQMQS